MTNVEHRFPVTTFPVIFNREPPKLQQTCLLSVKVSLNRRV